MGTMILIKQLILEHSERTISIGTGAFEDTITIGNVTGATAVNLFRNRG